MQDNGPSGWDTRVGCRLSLVAWDSTAWGLGLAAGAWFRYDGDLAALQPAPVLQAIALAMLVQLGLGVFADRLAGRHLAGVMDDAINVVEVIGAVSLVVLVTGFTGTIAVPRSVAFTATLLAIMLAAGLRLAPRLTREHRARPDVESTARVLIFDGDVGGSSSCGPCPPTRSWPSLVTTSVTFPSRRSPLNRHNTMRGAV